MELRVFSRRILSLNGQHRSLATCAKLGLAALLALVQTQAAQAQWAQGTGGDSVSQITDAEGIVWNVHTFTAVGTSELTVTQPGQIEYLLVGGGGGGASTYGWSAGGGGGGAVVVGSSTVTAGSYQVTVGAGGTGETPTDNAAGRATAGQPSSLLSVTASGGVAARRESNSSLPGGPGAGGASSNANGGPGIESSITGSAVRYGGGGGTARSGGVAGTGTDGGGNARVSAGSGLPGIENRGRRRWWGAPQFPRRRQRRQWHRGCALPVARWCHSGCPLTLV
jgi:hypothetical protein